MEINPVIMDIVRGAWALQPEALQYYGPLAYNLLKGKANTEVAKPSSRMDFFDAKGSAIKIGEDGDVSIPEGSVAVIRMVGALTKYGTICEYGADDYVKMLDFANQHPNIVGIVLHVDGPGGSVSSVGPFVEFSKRKQKPIVGLYETACSAHLWIMAALCDSILAENDISSSIGSIGVVLSWVDNRKYLESIGYTFHEVYPEESADKNKAIRLAMDGKYDLIKEEMLSPMARQFQEFIKERMPKLKTDVPGVLTGKTFGTKEAIEIGFTNGIATLEEAQNAVRILSELKNLQKSNF